MSDVFMHNSHRLPVTFARGGKRCTPTKERARTGEGVFGINVYGVGPINVLF